MAYDAVKHPAHYVNGRKFEPKDVIRDWRLNFNLGSALKYIARAGRKDDIVQDLEKAREYLTFEIDAIKADRAEKIPSVCPESADYQQKAYALYNSMACHISKAMDRLKKQSKIIVGEVGITLTFKRDNTVEDVLDALIIELIGR